MTSYKSVPKTFVDYFKSLSLEAHSVMVERQAGYGPGNIEGLGPYGVFSRLAEDKCARVGTSINGEIIDGKAAVAEGWFNPGVRDALIDIANYAMILIAIGEDQWSEVTRPDSDADRIGLKEKVEKLEYDELS